MGQTSFLRAQVQSPKATLKETKIVRVQWEQGNATKVLFDNYAITVEGLTEKFVLGVEGETTADFNFDLEKAYMDIPEDSNVHCCKSNTKQLMEQPLQVILIQVFQ
jgi:hypothetical protein